MSRTRRHALAALVAVVALGALPSSPAAPPVSARPLAPPANDNLAGARSVSALPFRDVRDTTEATSEAGEVVSSCSLVEDERGVWYRMDGLGVAKVVLDTAGSTDPFGDELDTVISVWTGGPGHPLRELICNDDADFVDLTSRVVLRLERGVTYFIKVGSNDELGGQVVLNAAAAPDEPANDDLAAAVGISGVPFSDRRDLRFATWEAGEAVSLCQFAWPEESGVWYRLDLAEPMSLVLDTEGSTDSLGRGLETVLSVWTGGPGHPLEEVDCSADAGGGVTWSRLIVDATPDEPLYVKVAGVIGATGQAQLNVRPVAAPPPNDSLDGAVDVPAVPFRAAFDSTAASVEPGERPASCSVVGAVDRSLWYRFRSPIATRVLFAVTDALFPPVVSLWTGDTHPLAEAGCGAEPVGSWAVGVTLDAAAGVTYYVRVSGMEGRGGPATLAAVAPAALPANDALADAVEITELPFAERRDSAHATDEPDEVRASCARAGGAERAVWYRFQPPAPTRLLLQGTPVEPSDVVAVVSAWTGTGHPLARELGCAVAPAGLALDVAAGQAVLIKIGPAYHASGSVLLRASTAPAPPANDNLADAAVVAAVPFEDTVDTRSASAEPGEVRSACSFDTTAEEAGVWYRLTTPPGESLTLQADSEEVGALVLSVWRGGPTHPLSEVTCAGTIRDGAARLTLEARPDQPTFVKVVGDVGLRGRIVFGAAGEPAPPPGAGVVFLPFLER